MADGRCEEYTVSGTKAFLEDSYYHEGTANGTKVTFEDAVADSKPSQLPEVLVNKLSLLIVQIKGCLHACSS